MSETHLTDLPLRDRVEDTIARFRPGAEEKPLRGMGLVGEPVAVAPPAPPTARPALAVLDHSVVQSMRALPGRRGPSLLPELIAMFRLEETSLPGRIRRLAGRRRRTTKLARVAHEFASACNTIGAAELSAAVAAIERGAMAGQWGDMPRLVAAMEEARNRLRRELADLDRISK